MILALYLLTTSYIYWVTVTSNIIGWLILQYTSFYKICKKFYTIFILYDYHLIYFL